MRFATISFIHNNDYFKRNENGCLEFNYNFKDFSTENSLFFSVNGTSTIIQLDTTDDSDNFIFTNKSKLKIKFSKAAMLSIMSDMVKSDKDFSLMDFNTSQTDNIYDLGLSGIAEDLSKEEFLNKLEDNFDLVYDTYNQVSISDELIDLSMYPEGYITYVSYDTEEHVENNVEDILLAVGNMLELYHSIAELEPIQLSNNLEDTKGVVFHPYSNLYKVVDYLKDNKETLPQDVQDSLNKDVMKLIENFSAEFKNKVQSIK